jgi:hypothetical protein
MPFQRRKATHASAGITPQLRKWKREDELSGDRSHFPFVDHQR